MNAFMRQVYEDVDNIFMNDEWVAEPHMVDGREMLAVIDTDKLAELKHSAQGQRAEELYRAEILLFVRPRDLGYKPAQGAVFRLDDDIYRVIEVTGETMYRIILGDNR